MEKKSKKEFHQLSEEQLQEVTGGKRKGSATSYDCIVEVTSCPSLKYDLKCNCIE